MSHRKSQDLYIASDELARCVRGLNVYICTYVQSYVRVSHRYVCNIPMAVERNGGTVR